MVNELYHYGVKGMKWGVRRFQKKNGDLYISKGTTVKRVSISRDDPTYDNKKYVSINQKDHSKWESYMGEAWVRKNIATWTQSYKTVKDLRVMSSTKQGELYTKMLLDKKFAKQATEDTEFATKSLGLQPVTDAAENISRNIAMQTKTGKAFVQKVLDNKYDAIVDTHGTNVAENPLIVLNADENLTRSANPEYTKPVQDFLKQYGLAA